MKTILIIDDTKANINSLINLLGDTYDILVARNGISALEIANEEQTIDLILLDIMMPKMDGYEVCQKLKANKKTDSIPIIFLTAKTDEESIERAYDIGGIDYVTKPFKPKELLARVKRELKLQELLSDLEQSQKELKLLAATDSMTKLYNRRYFSEVSQQVLALAIKENTELSIIMIDIDEFKNINDSYGHKVGDDVIITLASTLQEFTREEDIVCRFGGEEFLILLPHTDEKDATLIAQKIRKIVEGLSIEILDKKKLHFTLSIGISQIDILKDKNIEDSITRADKALYQAKHSGKNKVCVYKGKL